MRFVSRAFGLAGVVLFTACASDQPTAPEAAQSTIMMNEVHAARGVAHINVMTRNLYIGADVDKVIAALASPDPNDDVAALLGALTVLQATDFPTRAAAIAGEVAINHPDVIGLQEVSRLDVDLTALGIPTVVHQDFLAILLSALNARGLHYSIAATIQNTTAAPLPGISLVDFDALLVRDGRVEVGPDVVAKNYSNNIGAVAPGVTIIRGWVAINATIDGHPYTVASTHLESGSATGLDQLRAAQASELVGSLAGAPRVVILGDFNDVPGSLMYQVVTGAGYADTWGELRPRKPGYTCCQVEDLSNRVSVLDQRIDYVFARGAGGPRGRLLGEIRLLGDDTHDRVAGPAHKIWPSDHAGLAALLVSPPAWLAQH
ncbi:MAG: endonuclease/exonuclease/phosphatase family protein [Gemmatimonadales bacterium]